MRAYRIPEIALMILVGLLNRVVLAGETIDITLAGSEFSPFSRGCIRMNRVSQSSCLLNAIESGEYAIYDFELRADAIGISAQANISNPAHREIDVYIYNYGTRTETPQLSKSDLDPQWIRWETVMVDKVWKTQSPEFLDAASPGGQLDFLGPHNIVRILFYADPGIPPKNEIFIINSATLRYETLVDLGMQAKNRESKVWREGDKIYSYGIGNPPKNAINPGQGRAMAIRAATIDAQRNLLAYLKNIPLPPSGANTRLSISGQLIGATTENTEYFDDGSVRVTVAVSTKRVLVKSTP